MTLFCLRLRVFFLIFFSSGLSLSHNNLLVGAFRSIRQQSNFDVKVRDDDDNRRKPSRDKRIFGSAANSSKISSTALRASARFKNFEQVLDKFQTTPLMIYFSTPKCGPCQLMKREVEIIREQMNGSGMKIFSIDTEIYPSVGSRFAVASLPCLVVFHEGEVKLRLEGVKKAEEVVELVRTVQ